MTLFTSDMVNTEHDYLLRVKLLMSDNWGDMGNDGHALAVSFVANYPYREGMWNKSNRMLDALEEHCITELTRIAFTGRTVSGDAEIKGA